MNILSLDFDYYQIVDKETLALCYPDGKDLPPEMSEWVWSSYYEKDVTKDKLLKVRVNKGELLQTGKLLLKQKRNIPVLISYTHKDIYDFIHELADDGEPLKIVNVDMHHDMFNTNEILDCGNWLSHIMREYKTKLYWVVNKVSLDMYDAPELKPLVLKSVKDIPNMEFDAIFLCRSDSWLPPHLDKHFETLRGLLVQYFEAVKYNSLCAKPRTAYIEMAKAAKEVHEKMLDEIKSHRKE